jgi:hypothetical protein
MFEQRPECGVTVIDAARLLPLAPLSEDIRLGLLVNADRMQATDDREGLIHRATREI